MSAACSRWRWPWFRNKRSRRNFINYDDNVYVYNNPQVTQGLTPAAVAWSFISFHAANWHPLTWLSHALDCQLYGTQHPGLHHLTNVLLHAAVAILLFLILSQMTGSLWPSVRSRRVRRASVAG